VCFRITLGPRDSPAAAAGAHNPELSNTGYLRPPRRRHVRDQLRRINSSAHENPNGLAGLTIVEDFTLRKLDEIAVSKRVRHRNGHGARNTRDGPISRPQISQGMVETTDSPLDTDDLFSVETSRTQGVLRQ